MKKFLPFAVLTAVLITGCGKPKPAVDIWTAAGTGNIPALTEHLAARTDLNAREPAGGNTPLMLSAMFGQTEAARLLIGKGAKVDVKNNDGSTALHIAAFFCQLETAGLLLDKGADVNAKNNAGQTPLDTVIGKWTPDLERIYVYIAGSLHTQFDLERIKRDRPAMAELLRKNGT
jgi:hypothetical protein